ncbi:MAG TPA: S9 family peptidase [Vicinamibacterales bacterium]|nr:S9 family peptidase [Vicinamibacterales bacterium]
MIRRSVRPVSIALALIWFAAAVPAAQPKRGIAETDILKFVWIADPQISPDGSRVAFVRVDVNEKADTYDTAVWIAAADGREEPRKLTAGPRDHSPRWSPDGTHLAFVRAPEQDGRPQPAQIFVMAMAGGEGRAVTNIPRGAASPVWSPDGKRIAFTSTARGDEIDRDRDKKDAPQGAQQREQGAQKPRESDVRVITRAVYRANGVAGFGYVDPDRPTHVWTTTVPAAGEAPARPRQVTSGEFPASNHQWSPDGRHIYFVADRRPEPYYLPADSDLYAVPADGGEPTVIASIEGTIGAFAPAPDGKRIAFVGTFRGEPERSYSQPDLWVLDAPGGTPRNLTADYDFDIGGGLAGDQRAPRGSHPAAPVWDRDGRSVSVRAGVHGNADLVRVDVERGRVMEPPSKKRQEVMSYTAAANGGRFAMVISTPTAIGDLHVADGSGAPRRLTSFNDALFGQLTMSEPEEIWYQSFDGRRVQAWIQKPPAFEPSKKYPLIVQIHGGPHAAYGNTFTHEFHWMAAKGYVVLYTNPRGSSNYGQEFGNIIQFAYPGDDYKDIMAGVDEVLKKGYVDEARMGVTGGSGGGLLTNWTVTQTNRFKAAVSQRDISDWTNFWYTADFTLFRPTWFRRPPFQDPEDFARRSPITHVEKIQTPLLFILGDEDWRTPPSAGGEELFRALKYLKRETAMVRFPNENHDLSRSGKPWHRVERLQHIVGWFDRFLGSGVGTAASR